MDKPKDLQSQNTTGCLQLGLGLEGRVFWKFTQDQPRDLTGMGNPGLWFPGSSGC